MVTMTYSKHQSPESCPEFLSALLLLWCFGEGGEKEKEKKKKKNVFGEVVGKCDYFTISNQFLQVLEGAPALC